MAVLDLWGHFARVPLSTLLFGAAQHQPPSAAATTAPPPPLAVARSFYTAALNDDVAQIVAATRFGLASTPLLKIKLDADVGRARAILAALTACYDEAVPRRGAAAAAPLVPGDAGARSGVWSVDANAAWSADVARAYLDVLRPYGPLIYMVEQPFPLFRARAAAEAAAAGQHAELGVYVHGELCALPAEEVEAWVAVKV